MSKTIVNVPCATCPFRKDKPFYLAPGRRSEIARALADGLTFHCHNEVNYDIDDDDDAFGYSTRGARHCAGAAKSVMLAGGTTQMMRIAERLGDVNLDELEEKGPEVWDLDSWQRLNPEGTEVADHYPEPCGTVGPYCVAPAGYRGSNGVILTGTEGAELECEMCGDATCSECIDDQGLCGSCHEEMEDEDY